MTRATLTPSETPASVRSKKRVEARQGQKHPIGLRRQRRKSVSLIKSTAALDLLRVPAIENVEHGDGNSKLAAHAPDAFQGVDKKVAAISLSLESGINADHRDECRRDLPVARSGATVARRKILIVDRMRIEGIIADQAIVSICQDENTQISGLRQLVCCLAQEIINLVNTACKGRAIVAHGIERYDPQCRPRSFAAHWLEIVR